MKPATSFVSFVSRGNIFCSKRTSCEIRYNKTGARQYIRAVLNIYLLKFTLLTPFLHALFFSLLLLGCHPGSLMHYTHHNTRV